jgi:hypothetical protein
MKILVQAEAFCFGPSSIAARIVADLFVNNHLVDYVTNGTSVLISDRAQVNQFIHQSKVTDPILQQYDYVVIVMDWKFAKQAVEAGCKVIFVDALTWFWDRIDEVVEKFDCYLAINYAGVKSVVETINNPNSFVIPQTIDQPLALEKSEFGVFSIGGVTNPFLGQFAAINYTTTMIDSFLKSRPRASLFGNRTLDLRISTSVKSDFDSIIASARYFVGTSGLGHITECLAHSTPALFLPPVNDSQYLQLQAIGKSENWDYISWEDLGYNIDWSATQTEIIRNIEESIVELLSNKPAIQHLSDKISDFVSYNTANEAHNSLHQLSLWWGFNGEKSINDWITKRKVNLSASPSQLFPDNNILEQLTAEFPYFIHTSRPENYGAILESGIIKANPKSILYGDRLGSHGRLFGQLIDNANLSSIMNLAGCRFPVFLYPAKSILNSVDWHLSPTYSSGVLHENCISPFNPIAIDKASLSLANELVLDIDLSLNDCIGILVPDFMVDQFEEEAKSNNLNIPVFGFEVPLDVIQAVSNNSRFEYYSVSSPFILAYAKFKYGEDSEQYRSVLARETVR